MSTATSAAKSHPIKHVAPLFAASKMKVSSAEPTKLRPLNLFLNSDFRLGHDGLRAEAKKNKIDVDTLRPGEFLIFVNAKRDRLKLFGAHNVVAYWKARTGERVMMETIRLIPRAFLATGTIDYDSVLKETLIEALKRKRGGNEVVTSILKAAPKRKSA